MHWLLVLLVMVATLAPMDTDAGRKRWLSRRIQVYDYTPASWNGVISAVVDDANTIMPRRGPEVIYNRMEPLLCKNIARQYGIVVCIDDEPWPDFLQGYAGFMKRSEPHKKRVIVALRDGRWSMAEKRALACHEVIGHAILTIPDDYDSKTPAESCVHAWSERPGTWDAAEARRLYGKHR